MLLRRMRRSRAFLLLLTLVLLESSIGHSLGESPTPPSSPSLAQPKPSLQNQAAGEKPITRALDVRALPQGKAQLHPKARLRGLVTFRWPNKFVLQDDSAALWIKLTQESGQELGTENLAVMERVAVGDIVEVEGSIDPASFASSTFAPSVRARTVRIAGKSPLPPAPRLTAEDLRFGPSLYQRRLAEGTVSWVECKKDLWFLKLRSETGCLYIHVPFDPSLDRAKLQGAEIRVEGVTGVICNLRGEFMVAEMWTTMENVRIQSLPIKHAYSAPKVPLEDLARISVNQPEHRQRMVEGTVTYCEGGNIFLQSGQRAVRIRVNSPASLPVGARVEASGFLDFSRPVIGLADAAVRTIGTAPLPPAVHLSMPSLLQAFKSLQKGEACDYDGRLVWMDGLLSSIHHEPGDGWRLVIESDHRVATARYLPAKGLENAAQTALGGLRPGSFLRLTGVAEPQYVNDEPRRWNSAVPVGLDLHLRGPADVVLLKAAPWVTPARLGLGLAVGLLVAATVALAAMVWVLQLRRTVQRQSLRIEESLKTHRNAELEQHAAREERFRLAADLHDGLQQHLAGASYRIEAGLMRLGDDVPENAVEQFTAAQAALERTCKDLRECLVGLRGVEEGPADFPSLVRHTLRTTHHWPQYALTVYHEGDPFPLSRRVMGSLLLFVREAVGNAFKHGNPSKVDVTIRYLIEGLELEVRDDGKGFEETSSPLGRDRRLGLETMRHRLRWLGGNTQIFSKPGQGTLVTGYLSKSAAQPVATDSEPEDSDEINFPAEASTPIGVLASGLNV